MNNVVLTRYGEPGKYDYAPQWSLCKVVHTGNPIFDIYMQVNPQEDTPHWDFIGISDAKNDIELIERYTSLYAKP